MTAFYRNSKGNAVVEGLTILVLLTVFAIGGLYAYQSFDDLNTDIQDNDDLSSTAKGTSGGLFENFPEWLDGVFLFLFVMFTIFVLVSAFMIDTHPIFFAISIILLLGVFVTAIFLGNAYDDVASDDTITTYSNNLPYMFWTMSHIVELIVGIGFMTSIVIFVKFKMM